MSWLIRSDPKRREPESPEKKKRPESTFKLGDLALADRVSGLTLLSLTFITPSTPFIATYPYMYVMMIYMVGEVDGFKHTRHNT